MAKALQRSAPKAFPASVVRELEGLEADLGGRQALVGLLTLAPLTPDLRYILGLLGDPAHDRMTLASICAKGNILPGKLLETLGAAAMLKGKTLASQRIGEGIAAVVSDVMRRAAPFTTPCTTCMVAGEPTGAVVDDPSEANPNPEPEPCPACEGKRYFLHLPTLDTQKLAVELAGMLQKGGGIQIAVQQNALGGGVGGGSGALERMQQLTDQILYGEGPAAVEAEIVPDPETPATPAEAS